MTGNNSSSVHRPLSSFGPLTCMIKYEAAVFSYKYINNTTLAYLYNKVSKHIPAHFLCLSKAFYQRLYPINKKDLMIDPPKI